MRFKESILMDGMIDDRRKSLARDMSQSDMEKRVRVLSVLIEARDKLDDIDKPISVARDIAKSIRKEFRRGVNHA